jgi:2-C-methyl-D-erythritol 4-phosphate cytidylyltransferase
MSASAAVNPSSNQGNLAAQPPRIWALIPAAGVGARMGNGQSPKQFLKIGEVTILERTVQSLCSESRICQVVVVVSPEDTQSQQVLNAVLTQNNRVLLAHCGGPNRAASVANGLAHCLAHGALASDWVLVHDAARPGLTKQALNRLITTVFEASKINPDVGGLLALPVVDTVKRQITASEHVQATVSRDGLWLAQTPQMFRIGLLAKALSQFSDVTDESSAMEAAGHSVLLVQGERENFKITLPEDLVWANRLLL